MNVVERLTVDTGVQSPGHLMIGLGIARASYPKSHVDKNHRDIHWLYERIKTIDLTPCNKRAAWRLTDQWLYQRKLTLDDCIKNIWGVSANRFVEIVEEAITERGRWLKSAVERVS
ncbi:MAG: hypothetical protein ACJZ8O_08200 [Pirellulaceae bacterium]